MEILVAIVLGAFVGWVASIVMRTDASQGWLGNIVVGIVGAFLGNFVARLFGAGAHATITEFSWTGLFWAFIGACILLAAVNAFRSGGKRIR